MVLKLLLRKLHTPHHSLVHGTCKHRHLWLDLHKQVICQLLYTQWAPANFILSSNLNHIVHIRVYWNLKPLVRTLYLLPNTHHLSQGFLRRFRDPIRVPRISNRVPRMRENYHRVPKIRKNRVPRIREIGSIQIRTGFLTFYLKKTV